MDLPTLWPQLEAETRDWLVAHNGEPLAPAILDALTLANGGFSEPGWLSDHDDDGPALTDEAIDWIESVANGEQPSDI